MKISRKQLDLQTGLKREWLISNGIGGFASSTVLGANTRRYHGLLIAPLLPPASRHLLISKLDESIKIGDKKYNLFTNLCKNYVSEGYKYLQGFEKKYIPIFNFKVNNINITKKVTMVYGRNTVVVTYTIKTDEEDAILTLAPIVSFRDFHHINTNGVFKIIQKIDGRKVRLEINGNAQTPIYTYVSEGNYIEHNNDIFENMYYLKEDERGFIAEENLVVSGRYEIYIPNKTEKTITFVGSLEDNTENVDGEKAILSEIKRQKDIIEATELVKNIKGLSKEQKNYNEFITDLIISADSFIISRPQFGTKSIIAGYHWFLDWGRDAFIAFEGLLLITKRFEDAKQVFRTFTRDIKQGLVPNGYSGFDGRPMYNSVDASLLLIEQVNKYLKYTGDYKFVKVELYDSLKDIIDNYCKGTNLAGNNVFIDKDGLICSGTYQTQNTWMDAKIGDYVVTPRNGKVVEINALWYNSLKTLEFLAKKFGDYKDAEEYKQKASKCKTAFNKKFYNTRRKCLYDVLGDGKIRPNQLFAISTTYPVMNLSSENAKAVFNTVTDKLLTRYGLRTLSRIDEGYIGIYEGDSFKRDMSYHQGVSWVWLLGLYSDAFINIINSEKDKKEKNNLKQRYKLFIDNVYSTFKKELYNEENIQSISELYNSKPPYKPGGTCAQAWSISEIIKICTKMNDKI